MGQITRKFEEKWHFNILGIFGGGILANRPKRSNIDPKKPLLWGKMEKNGQHLPFLVI